MWAALVTDQRTACMQAKVQELEGLTTQQASQVATLREELQGSLAELDEVSLLAYYTCLSSTCCPCRVWRTVTSQLQGIC